MKHNDGLALLASLLLATLGGAAVVAKEDRPNILFIIADDMRPEMFNFLPQGQGKNLSPTLDRLAREGVIMRRQYVASPVCTPSRYNCLTVFPSCLASLVNLSNLTRSGGCNQIGLRIQGSGFSTWN